MDWRGTGPGPLRWKAGDKRPESWHCLRETWTSSKHHVAIQFVLAENAIISITKKSQLMQHRAVKLFIVRIAYIHTLWVGGWTCGTYTYHGDLNAECSLIHSADCTSQSSSPVTAQFICPVLPYPSTPCLSILRWGRGWPPSLSISLAAHKTVIQTLLVVCGGASAAHCNCGRLVPVRYKECGWTVVKLYCCCTVL